MSILFSLVLPWRIAINCELNGVKLIFFLANVGNLSYNAFHAVHVFSVGLYMVSCADLYRIVQYSLNWVSQWLFSHTGSDVYKHLCLDKIPAQSRLFICQLALLFLM